MNVSIRYLAGVPVVFLLLFAGPITVSAITNTQSTDLERSSSQYFSAPDASSLDITGDITVEAWVKPESNPATNGSEFAIVSKWNNDIDQRSYYFRYLKESDGSIQLGALTSADGTNFTVGGVTYTLPVDEWTHIAMVCSGSTLTIYVDGTSIGTSSCTSSKYSSSSSLGVGALVNNSSTHYFDGLMDEVRIWNDARTQSEIQNNMFVSLTGAESNLVSYWNLNATSTDKTANSNSLTPQGSPVYSEEPAHNSTCTFNYSSMFMGTLTSFPSCSIAFF